MEEDRLKRVGSQAAAEQPRDSATDIQEELRDGSYTKGLRGQQSEEVEMLSGHWHIQDWRIKGTQQRQQKSGLPVEMLWRS